MFQYILRRLLFGAITVFLIATATFFAVQAVPGNPLDGEKAVNATVRRNLEKKYKLDKPVHIQYYHYMKNLCQGDLGISFKEENRRVNDIIREHFPVSAKMGFMAVFFATIGGILWGAITALYRDKWPDYVIMFFVILGISVPGFVFASLAQLGIGRLNSLLGWEISVAGYNSVYDLIIPSFALGIGTLAFVTRIMRTSLLEVINENYVRTAKAKGLSPIRIFCKHQLRNAILPVITIIGPTIAGITVGSFVIEQIFSIPGLGRYFIKAVQNSDYTVVMGTTVFYGSFLILMVLLVDIMYGFVDPRIKVEG